jgi:hypothetical protein
VGLPPPTQDKHNPEIVISLVLQGKGYHPGRWRCLHDSHTAPLGCVIGLFGGNRKPLSPATSLTGVLRRGGRVRERLGLDGAPGGQVCAFHIRRGDKAREQKVI